MKSNNPFEDGSLKFIIPISLIAWALFILLLLNIAGCTSASAAEVEASYQGPHGFAVIFKPLSTETTITETLWQAENIIDLQQTLKIARNPQSYSEVGTLSIFTGPNPSVRQVYLGTALFAVAHFGVTRLIENLVDENPDYRVLQRVWSYSTLGAKTWNMQRNAHIGLGY